MPLNPQSLAGLSLMLVAAAIIPLGLFVPLGIAPLAIIAAVLALPLTIRRRVWARIPRMIIVVPLALAGWAAITALWALDPRDALAGAGKQALSSIGGMVVVCAALELDEGWRLRVGRVVVAMVVIAELLLFWEFLSDKGMSFVVQTIKGHQPEVLRGIFGRGATVTALAACAAVAFLWRRGPRWLIPMIITAATGMFLGDSLSTRMALLAAIATGVTTWLAPRLAGRTIMVAILGLCVLLPVGARHIPDPQYTFQNWQWVPMSSHHRLTIWGFTGARVAERPLLGWGMEASRTMPGADEEVQVWRYDREGQRTNVGLKEPQLPLHPHNAVLQLWLELGVVGVILFAVMGSWMAVRLSCQPNRMVAAAGMAALACGLVIATVSYGFWQSWWQATMWLSAAMMVTVAGPQAGERLDGRIGS